MAENPGSTSNGEPVAELTEKQLKKAAKKDAKKAKFEKKAEALKKEQQQQAAPTEVSDNKR